MGLKRIIATIAGALAILGLAALIVLSGLSISRGAEGEGPTTTTTSAPPDRKG